LQAVTFGSLFINLLFSCSLVLLWGLINTIQLIVHVPLVSVAIPGNALSFFILLIDIANFNIFDVSGMVRAVMEFPDDDEAYS